MKRCSDKKVGEWVALYEMGALEQDQRAIFLDHLIECEYCHNQVYSMEPVMTAFRDHRTTARRDNINRSVTTLYQSLSDAKPRRFWNPMPLAAAFSLMLVIGIAVVYLLARNHQTVDINGGSTPALARSQWQDIEIPKPLYTAPTEQVVLRNPAAKAFDRAMAAYQENDFASAIGQLDALSESQPGNIAEVKFYLGVSLLLVGRSQDAIPHLRQAVESSTGPQLESSHYYLALAYLKSDQPDQAVAELDAVIAMAGAHRPSAEKLKQQMSDISK